MSFTVKGAMTLFYIKVGENRREKSTLFPMITDSKL
jgi:hypothetical protein